LEGTRRVDQDGNRVDFNSKEAVIPGNCTAQGDKYHETMAAKGWERKSHEYCQQSCPLLAKCEEKGYLSQFKNDGRNAYATFAHLFTSTPESFHAVVVDEPSYKDFVRIDEVQDADLWQLLGFTFNWGMAAIIKALRYLLQEVQSQSGKLDLPFQDSEQVHENDFEPMSQQQLVILNGVAFYLRLDEICRKLFGQNRGLLELVRLAENAGGWYNSRVSDLLDERTVEAADKLPPNLWQPEGMVPAPGMGGLYDVIKEESSYALSGLFAGQPFASRVELVKEGGNNKNKQSQAKLVLHRRRYPTAELSKKALTVLDGTGNSQLLKTLFTSYENLQSDKELKKVKPIWARRATPRVKTVQPVVEMSPQVSILQDTARNYSMSSLLASLKKDPGRRYWGRYVDSVRKYLKPDGKRTLVVCTSKVEQELASSLVECGISETNGYRYALAHYGGLRGSNEFEDYDRVILAGMYMVNPSEVVRSYRALFASPDEAEFDATMLRRARFYSLEKDGEGFSDDVMEFRHKGLQQLMNTVSRDEMVQALHRIRPIGTTSPKEIVLLMGIPLDGIPVGELISNDENPVIHERSHRTLSELVAAGKRLLGREGKSYFTVAQLALESGRKLGETVYKYFKEVARQCGAKAYGVECVQRLKDGGLRLRTFTVAVHASGAELAENSPVEVECCISRTLIRTLINYGEIQQLLPKGWKLAGEDDPVELELPALPQTEEVEEQAGTLRAGEALVVWQRLVELKAQYEVLPVATLAKGLVGESYLVKAEELALLTGHRRPLVRRE
jgi:hypothetical protein